MIKRISLLFILAMAGLSMLYATGNREVAKGGNAPVVVAVWSSPEHDNLVKAAKKYTELTGTKIIIEEIAREAYFDKLNTVIVAQADAYDVCYVSTDVVPAMIKAGGLTDLYQFINDKSIVSPDFDLSAIQAGASYFIDNGKLYAFPSEGDTAWMFYRKDLLKKNGFDVPQTWDEYLKIAKALNNPPTMYGAVIGAKPDEALWDYMHYLYSFGGDVLDANNNVIINNKAGVKSLEFYSGLALNGLVPPDVITYGYNEILTTLQQGKAALGIEWMAATSELTNADKSSKVSINGKSQLAYALVPGIKQADGTILRGMGASQWGWSILKAGKNKTGAYKFIEWLTGKEGAIIWALNGGIPSNTKALSDPEVLKEIPQFGLLAKAMKYRHIFPSLSVSGPMVTIYNEAITGSVAGKYAPKEALDKAATKMTKLLKEAGYLK